MQFVDEISLFKPSSFVKKIKDCPKTVIVTWQDGFLKFVQQIPHKIITILRSCGAVQVLNLQFDGFNSAFAYIPLGSPVVAQLIEELNVIGVENFVFIGSCGLLDEECKEKLIVPCKALRDEGTSWHYIESKDEFIDCVGSKKTTEILSEMNLPFVERPVWTTDTVYRETPTSVRYAKERGCCAVDMECSAINAVAQYLGVNVFQVMYTADSLAGKEWNVGKLTKMESNEYGLYFEVAKQIARKIDKE